MATGQDPRVPLMLAALLVACSSASAPAGEASGGQASASAASAGESSQSAAGNGGAVGEAHGGGTSASSSGSGGSPTASQGGAGNGSGGSPTNSGASNAGSAGLSTAGSAGSTAIGTPTEKPLAKLPAARQEHAVVAAAGEVYVIGGYNPNITDSVQAYDPTKDKWRDAKSFPVKTNHVNAGAINDRIYVAGFYINGGMSTATTDAYTYDPKTDAWTKISPLPAGTQRAASCVAVDAGLMYVVGGANAGKSVNNAARYDPTADSWEELPVLPERREHCSAGFIKGVLYIAGGRADGITGIQAKTWAFEVTTKTWTEKASLAPPRGGVAGAALANRLFVFGGEGNTNASNGVFPDIDAYDPSTNQWQALPPMLLPRHGYGAAVLGGRIYLAGGADHQGAGGSDEVSVFSLE